MEINEADLRMQFSALSKNLDGNPWRLLSRLTCSKVTAIAVRSLALLQLVIRTPESSWHIWK